jgi:type IV secretion system protein VirB9
MIRLPASINPVRPFIAFALLLSSILAANTLAPAPASAQDPRLVEIFYNPASVTVIRGRAKVQATIMFGDDEAIENVAIGDSTAWQVTPNKQANLLFVKPLATRAVTNMTVVTSKRTYLFDLVASPRSRPVYVVRFAYPDEPEAPPQLTDARNDVERQATTDPRAVLDPAALNFDWAKKGEESLFPVRIFDNGEAVFLSWPQGKAVPAILIEDAKGTEGPVNFTVRGDTIVVDGAPRQIILRSGKESARLSNNGPIRPDPIQSVDPSLASAGVQ